MKMILTPATTPGEYLGGLSRWQCNAVGALRQAALSSALEVEVRLKLGHRDTPLDLATVLQLARKAARLIRSLANPTRMARS